MSKRSSKRMRMQEEPHVDGRCTSATQGNQLRRDRCPNETLVEFSQNRVPIPGLREWQKKRSRCTRIMMTASCECRLEVTVPVDGETPENQRMVALRALDDIHPQRPALPAPVFRLPAPVVHPPDEPEIAVDHRSQCPDGDVEIVIALIATEY